ncbi:MAG: hypothetical protein IPJ76_12900 [Flavobacteriales bacterium]|nr:MAG: hypothetical protein IPJ76_12900 [Flavobacteriales bacterium]
MKYTPSTLLLLPVVLAAFFVACNGKKAATSSAIYGGSSPGDSLFFTLTKTPCFGKCPAYTVNVYRSGYATYNGKSHVEKTGEYMAHVGMDTLALLLAKAEAIGFFDLQDVYDSQVTDLPSTTIVVAAGGRSKQVKARHQVPQQFKDFAAYAEGLLQPVAWKPLKAQD